MAQRFLRSIAGCVTVEEVLRTVALLCTVALHIANNVEPESFILCSEQLTLHPCPETHTHYLGYLLIQA
jgi:hypothetical protein